jgi:two-component system sensor histidine kinase/response regulator
MGDTAHRILVVEDEPAILGYCQTVLKGAGFEVDGCSTVAEARRLYGDNPDLIILDYGLPDGNGLDLMREWQKRGRTPPILFLTGRGDLRTRLDCFQAGAQDYLLKPFAAEELLARAKVQLNMKKSHDELIRRNYELELITRARADMADMIVHDLKAPLTSIKGTLELIAAHGLISEGGYKKLIATAGTAADFMLLMLNDLLDVGQSRGGSLKAERAAFEMDVLVDKLEKLFAGRAQSLGLTMTCRVAKGCEKVVSDQNLVYRIGANLIGNALKASRKGAQVEVDVARKGDKFLLTVSDRGRGVPDAEKQRIFEKYTTSQRGGPSLDTGTGLGLAFCTAASKALGGRVWVEDREGGGSLFFLEAPAA